MGLAKIRALSPATSFFVLDRRRGSVAQPRGNWGLCAELATGSQLLAKRFAGKADIGLAARNVRA